MNDLGLLAVMGLVAGVCFLVAVGTKRCAVLGLVGSCVLAPWPLYVSDDLQVHYGITTGAMLPTTYFLAVAFGLVVLRRSKRAGTLAGVAALTLFGYLLIAMTLFWERTPQHWAGILLIGALVAAISLGGRVAAWVGDSAKNASWWVALLAGTLIIELALCALQSFGYPVSIYPEVHLFGREGRAIGSFNHPSTLGKFVFLATVLLLPMTAAGQRRTSRTAWIGILAGLLATGLTESRANGAAVVATILLWLLLQNRFNVSFGRRAAVLLVAAIAAVPAVVTGMRRFALDPVGGNRERLLESGLEQIRSNPWWGVGPNSYVEVVGQWDALVAAGYPVHNVFLMMAAELGAVGAVLLFLPIAAVVVQAVRLLGSPRADRLWAVAIISGVPGLMLILWTGWGMIAASTGIFWYFTWGFAAYALRVGDVVPDVMPNNTGRSTPRELVQRRLQGAHRQ